MDELLAGTVLKVAWDMPHWMGSGGGYHLPMVYRHVCIYAASLPATTDCTLSRLAADVVPAARAYVSFAVPRESRFDACLARGLRTDAK